MLELNNQTHYRCLQDNKEMGYMQQRFCQEAVLPRKHLLFFNEVIGFADKEGTVNSVS